MEDEEEEATAGDGEAPVSGAVSGAAPGAPVSRAVGREAAREEAVGARTASSGSMRGSRLRRLTRRSA